MAKAETVSTRFVTAQCRATLARILAATTSPSTVQTIAATTGLSVSTVKVYTRHLRATGQMHIGGWDGHGELRRHLLLAGEGEDAAYMPGPGQLKKLKPLPDDIEDDGPPDPIETRTVVIRPAVTTGQARRDRFSAALFGEYRGAHA